MQPKIQPLTLTPQLARTALSLLAQLTQSTTEMKAQRDFFEEHTVARLEILETLDALVKSLQTELRERDQIIAELQAEIARRAADEKDLG